MGLFNKKKDSNTQPTAPTSQPGAVPPGAPRPPMGPNMAPPPPGAPKPPMGPNMAPPPPGAPRPPMGPNMAPPPPGAPRPPMGPGSTPPGAPRPPMGPNMAPPSPNAPRPPMGPAASPVMGPKPPMGPTSSPAMGPKPPMVGGFPPPPGGQPGFGPSGFGGPKPPMSSPSPMSFSSPSQSSSFSSMDSGGTNLDGILVSKKGYVAPKSIRAGGKCTYDEFCSEITYDFLDNLLKSPNMMEHKQLINKIKKTLIFALTNTKDLPDGEREILFTATIRFIDFLKGVVYYPEKDVINEEVITFIPFLKDTAYAFRSFLLKNR